MNKLLVKIIYSLYNLSNKIFWETKYNIYKQKYGLPVSFRFNGHFVQMYGEGEIEIGEGSYIGAYSTLQAKKGYRIKIGDSCRIAGNVKIYTGTNVPDQDFSQTALVKKHDNVTIGNFVWIGSNVYISPGVVIGDNSIIGANSVVVKDVKPFSIVGGVPAKLIRFKRTE